MRDIHHNADAQWGEGLQEESFARFEVADADTNVVEHCATSIVVNGPDRSRRAAAERGALEESEQTELMADQFDHELKPPALACTLQRWRVRVCLYAEGVVCQVSCSCAVRRLRGNVVANQLPLSRPNTLRSGLVLG